MDRKILYSLLCALSFSFFSVAVSDEYDLDAKQSPVAVVSEIHSDGKWDYVFEVSSHSREKYERHKKDAEPILLGELTAFRSFYNGFEKPLTGYIKLGNEERPIRRIIEGKEVVNEETQVMGKILKNLLKDYNSVQFVKEEGKYFVISDGDLYDLKSLLEFVNFNQIKFSNALLKKFHSYIDLYIIQMSPSLPNVFGRPTQVDFIKADPEGLCKNLSLPEKEAINIYTGPAYRSMNAFLRGDLDDVAYYDHPYIINTIFREVLLTSAVAVFALNRLPDFVPPPNPDGSSPKYLYRGEKNTPEKVLNERKWAVKEGGEVTLESGFLSTSHDKPNEHFFSEDSSCGIMYRSLKGKKITPLSMYGSLAREVLIPPTHIQWRYHKDIVSDVYKNRIAVFIAKPVTAPLGTMPRAAPLLDSEVAEVLLEE